MSHAPAETAEYRRKKVNKFVIGTAAIVLIFVVLVVVVMRGTQTYYLTVSELADQKGELIGQRFRVSGLARQVELLARPLRFMLEWEGKTLPVTYVGLRSPPDTFAEGVETVVTGTLESDGQFKAEQIQCKCGSKYEAETLRHRTGE
jgi:cytochrome c-type biogenesis protein CcmE